MNQACFLVFSGEARRWFVNMLIAFFVKINKILTVLLS